MCYYVENISETDSDWECSLGKGESSVAELNGHKREMAVLHESSLLATSIYRPETHKYSLQNRSVVCQSLETMKLNPLAAGGSVTGGLTVEWGGTEGAKWSAGVSGEVHDNRGNYAKAELNQGSDGKGRADVSAGHKTEKE